MAGDRLPPGLSREARDKATLDRDAFMFRGATPSGKLGEDGSRSFSVRVRTPLEETITLVEKWCAGLLSDVYVRKVANVVLKLSGGVNIMHPSGKAAKTWDVRASLDVSLQLSLPQTTRGGRGHAALSAAGAAAQPRPARRVLASADVTLPAPLPAGRDSLRHVLHRHLRALPGGIHDCALALDAAGPQQLLHLAR